ncbi:hypothetical protein G6F62_012578 [Rhizopus arrhizus]|nr:hypothetical protein G6F62_012578 [Rhizopus arrhizus]
MQFVLRYSIPVFVQPASGKLAARLQARLLRADRRPRAGQCQAPAHRAPRPAGLRTARPGDALAARTHGDRPRQRPDHGQAQWRVGTDATVATTGSLRPADVSGAGATGAADVSGVSADAILPPPTPLTASQTLYLDVSLNSTPRGLLPFTDNRGRLQASPEVLRQLGFNASGDAPVYLDQISGAVVRYDAHMQTLALDVPLDQLTLPTTVLSRPQARAPAGSASPGVLFNYDVYGSRVDTLGNLSLSSELRLFGIGNGTFENTAISRRYQQPGDRRWRGESVRLDTRWSLDFPDQAMTLEVGDFYSGFVDWTRPVRLGGLQIGRNYGLQPYRVQTPAPTVLGGRKT